MYLQFRFAFQTPFSLLQATDVTTILTDSDAESLGFPLDFPSTWRTSKPVATATCQTLPLSFSENQTQTVEYKEAHVRVSPIPLFYFIPSKDAQNSFGYLFCIELLY